MTSITSTAQWSTRINQVIFAVLDVSWTMGLNSDKTSKVFCINFSEKLSDFDEISYTISDIEPGYGHVTKNWIFFKFKMAAAAILKFAFLAINHRPIVRFQPNFVWGSRTAGRQGLRDKNCKFLKSNMADGRHFENRKIAISQGKIVRFWWNLVHYIRYWTRLRSRDQTL